MAGARAMTCMKHVGMNVAADPLFTAAYTGVNGGLVIVVADDPAMHSSQNEQDSRYYARAAHIADAGTVRQPGMQGFYETRVSIERDSYDTPVIMRLTTRIAHARSLVKETAARRRRAQTLSRKIRRNTL